MSDTINVLNQIVGIASKRKAAGDGANEEEFKNNLDLLEKIVVAAGDCLEDHIAARDRAKPRKQRVYKEIVDSIAVYFCDQCDTEEGAYFAEDGVRNVLAAYGIETVDFEGNTVKIS